MVFHNYLSSLAVALGVGGSLALRPTSPGAVRARIVAVVILVMLVAATQGSVSESLLLALLALPTIGIADAISRATRP
jgi:hypothetical protein